MEREKEKITDQWRLGRETITTAMVVCGRSSENIIRVTITCSRTSMERSIMIYFF